jgi:hypothetical protein
MILVNTDTDAISLNKLDQSPFTKEEQYALLAELNSIMDEGIVFDHDGYFTTFIVAKAKNYLMVDENGKRKTKGSAFKSSKMEKSCKDLQTAILDAIVEERYSEDELKVIYQNAFASLPLLTDIREWASRKTITEKVLQSPRKQERDIRDAVEGKGYSVGDKVFLYFTNDGKLKEVGDYAQDHDLWRLVKKLYNCTGIFTTFLSCTWRINYSLKSNKKLIYKLWGLDVPTHLYTKKELLEIEMAKYTPEMVLEIASKYKTLTEFRLADNLAYQASVRMKLDTGLPKTKRGPKVKKAEIVVPENE